MESFIKVSRSVLQCGHLTRSIRDGLIATSSSQALHLKCIIGAMRAFIVILLVAFSVHAQSLADAARQERERRAHLKPAEVVKAEGSTSTAPAPAAGAAAAKPEEGKKPQDAAADTAKPADTTAAEGKTATAEKATDKTTAEKQKEPAKPQAPAVDPTKEWNDQLQRLRAKIQALQEEEASVQLQINVINNQIFAPVVDQATKDQALARVGEARQRLEAVRLELDQTRKTLESTQLLGPPKK
jgi:hypothetical protein